MAYDIGPSVGITGEKEFKAALANINNEFKLLGSEMKLAVSQFDKNDKSTAALTAQNQVLGKEIDSQKGRISTLTTQYDKQNRPLTTLKTKLDATKAAFSADSAEVAKAQKEYDKQNNAVMTLQTQLNGATTGLNSMNRELVQNNEQIKKSSTEFDGLSDKINSKVNGAFKALAIGITGAVVGMGALIMKSAENANETQKLADTYGITAERVQEIKYAATNLNVDFETLLGTQSKLTKAMFAAKDSINDTGTAMTVVKANAEDIAIANTELDISEKNLAKIMNAKVVDNLAVEKAQLAVTKAQDNFNKVSQDTIKTGKDPVLVAQAEAFKELGVTITDSSGKLRDSKVVMFETFDALGKMTNETERDALSMKLFGKSAMELNPIIKVGSKEFENLANKAHESGKVISNESVEALNKFNNTITTVKESIMGTISKGLAPLAPKLQELADKFSKMDTKPLTDGLKWVMDNGQTIVTVVLSVAGALVAYKVAVVASIVAEEIYNAILIVSALTHGGLSAAVTALTAATGGKVAATLIASGVFIAHNIALAASAVAHGIAAGAIGIATAAQRLFNAAMSANPIGLIITALALLGLAIYEVVKHWKEICEWIGKAWDWLTKWNGTPAIDKSSTVTTTYATKPGLGNQWLADFWNAPSYAIGTKYLPQDMLIQAHKGEMIVPRSENPYANSGGGTMPQGGDIIIPVYIDGKFNQTITLTSQQIATAQRQRTSFGAVTA